MKASEIDWSKAPEGATHFMPENSENWASWYKKHDGKWMCWVFDGDLKWSEVGYDEDYILNNSIAKREEWNGTGLPPVGTLIEYRHRCLGDWRRGQVNYASCEYLILVEYGVSVERHYFTSNMEVRPIRTPEQIAAAERDREVDAMMETFMVTGSVKSTLRSACLALYDAGYRKVEGDEQ